MEKFKTDLESTIVQYVWSRVLDISEQNIATGNGKIQNRFRNPTHQFRKYIFSFTRQPEI
jgi:hypothetical protein